MRSPKRFLSLLLAFVGLPGQSAASYVLGPGDDLDVLVLETAEASGRFSIDDAGMISLPLVGRVQAAGVTVNQLQLNLAEHLKALIVEPNVTVTVAAFGSRPVWIRGEVRNPGRYQIGAGLKLSDLIALAGGVTASAGTRARVFRPGDNAVADVDGEPSPEEAGDVIEADLSALLQNPAADVALRTRDIVVIQAAASVFVIGEVGNPTTIALPSGDEISVLEALARAGGLTRMAAANKARILRPIADSSRRESFDVDLKHLLRAEAAEQRLAAGDILFVPSSKTKERTQLILQALMGGAISAVTFRALGASGN